MKSTFKFEFLLIFFSFLIIPSCKNDMSRDNRIKNYIALKNIKNIALINFAINQNCTIGSGEDVGFIDNLEQIKSFGKYHMAYLNDVIKIQKSPRIIDLNEMANLKNYQSLSLKNRYVTNRIEKLPRWLSPGIHFVNAYESIGVIWINSDNSRELCNSLNTDAVLSIEVTYLLDNSINIPLLGNFIKPKWSAYCKVNCVLFDSTGELVWRYEFKSQSPTKVKASKSRNFIIYSSSSITSEQTNEIIESVVKFSSQKIIDALYSDINDLP